MPRINLLPWRDQQRKERRIAFFVALAVAAIASVVVAGGAYLLYNSWISAQEARNQLLQAEIKKVDRQIEQINDLESQKQRFIARMQVIDKLQRSRSEEVHLFDEIARAMPDGTYLTSFKQEGRKLKFQGVALSSTRVSALMRNIQGSQYMQDPELEVVEAKKDNTNGDSFTLDATQVLTADEAAEASAAQKPVRHARAGGAP